MKIVCVRFVLSFFVFFVVLVGCNPQPTRFVDVPVKLIDRSILIDVYDEEAKVVIAWMHKNNYGLLQQTYEEIPLYFEGVNIPIKSLAKKGRHYNITHNKDVVAVAPHNDNTPGVGFTRVERGDILLEVHPNFLIIRIKDVGHAHLSIDFLNEIASTQPEIEPSELNYVAVADLTIAGVFKQIAPTPIEAYQGEDKKVAQWMHKNNYRIVKDYTFHKYFISNAGKHSELFYVGEIEENPRLARLADHNLVIYHVPIDDYDAIEVVEKIEFGDLSIQTEQNHFIVRVKGVGEATFPIDINFSDAKLFQLKKSSQR